MMERMPTFLLRPLPAVLEPLATLALDLRWTWSHAGDVLWRRVNPDIWDRTRNPWVTLQESSQLRLDQVAQDPAFQDELQRLQAKHQQYLDDPAWYGRAHAGTGPRRIAYFSMEFGLGESLPLYAGGLGILAGDYLKTASDLGVPVVGVGLLYQEGYSRQVLDAAGRPQDLFPYNDPTSLPLAPALDSTGGWLCVRLDLPGRSLLLRVWQARVGRVPLYLLDSNDPLNSPADRSITSKLYGDGPEVRLLQEMVLGVGGWRLLETLGLGVEVCHLNEGHAAFAVLERARTFRDRYSMPFWDALWATRAGNVFTTHTPVAAGFDTFDLGLIQKYALYSRDYLARLGISLEELLALGRKDPRDPSEPFNMTYLALRGCGTVNGVSRLHGAVSRHLFRELYPRWPEQEVPVGHITNGVHVPSWDSAWADRLWTRAGGKERWRGTLETLSEAIQACPDEELWTCRAAGRQALIQYARERLARQLGQRGTAPETVAQAAQVLDPNVLTLGFARRFAAYKRPTLLLHDPARLVRLLTAPEQPVQLVLAGKPHPADDEGKRLVEAWAAFVRQPAVRHRAVFLEDYDMTLAQELVQGVDVWLNTPRRPWEACGTSGMKVLVNGGLNCSALDGWWAEAYTPEVGWALGDDQEHCAPDWDAREAEDLYRRLEQEIVPEFYRRDTQGIPRAWVARMRASMAQLAPWFSSNRMLREYVEGLYLPAAAAFRRRSAQGAQLAQELRAWQTRVAIYWSDIRFGNLEVQGDGSRGSFSVQVNLGEVDPQWVQVELYAEPVGDGAPIRQVMDRGDEIPGAINGYVYRATVFTSRPPAHFTPRVIPAHPAADVPLEEHHILWYR
jgi:glycogen phosphorylase